MSRKVKPGQTVPVSGQYRPVGGGHEVTMVRGKTVPPTRGKGGGYVMVDKTKHKSGR